MFKIGEFSKLSHVTTKVLGATVGWIASAVSWSVGRRSPKTTSRFCISLALSPPSALPGYSD